MAFRSDTGTKIRIIDRKVKAFTNPKDRLRKLKIEHYESE